MLYMNSCVFFFFQAEDGIRDRSPSRGLGDVYKRQYLHRAASGGDPDFRALFPGEALLHGVTLVRSRLYAHIQQNYGPGRMSPRCVCYGFLHSLGGAVMWDVDHEIRLPKPDYTALAPVLR